VKTTGSTDQGVGFLVAVDGLTLYHAGDHARWTESQEQDFMTEIQWLKSAGPQIDVAFFPIATGAACDPRASIWEGVRSAAFSLTPRVLVRCTSAVLTALIYTGDFVRGRIPAATQVVSPARLGERFRYAARRMISED
jgi:hypothetical protein